MRNLIFLTIALSLRIFGDATSAPHTIVAVSGMGHSTISVNPFTTELPPGSIIVRIQEFQVPKEESKPPTSKAKGFGDFGPLLGEGKRLTKPIVSVYRFDSHIREYEKIYEFEIETDDLAEVVVPDNSGQNLAFIYLDRNNAGLRIFTDKGTKSNYWPIKDFLKPRHREITGESVTTVQWFDSGNFTNSTFSFKGPNQEIDLTSMEKDNPDAVKAIREGYHFTVNLETGEFQELKYEKGVLMYIPVKSESPNKKTLRNNPKILMNYNHSRHRTGRCG